MLEKIPYKHHVASVLKHGVLPFLFYFLLFCILTYPLILRFSTHFFSDAGDGLQNIWNIWWINLSVLRPNLYPVIWHTDMLHWPFGTTLLGLTLNSFNGYLAIFLRRFLSLTMAYNTIVVFAFVMSGLTMYWLSHCIVRSFWPSIIAGFIFTFSSYHFTHAEGHLNLISMEWIPLFILFWYLFIIKPNSAIAVGAAVSLWLVMLCDYYYFFYCVLAAILIVLWHMVVNKNVWFFIKTEYLLPLIIFLMIGSLLILPIVGSLVLSNYRDPFIGGHNPLEFSLDLFALFIPGGHWLFNQWTEFYWSRLPGNIHESSVNLAISSIVLVVYVWIKRKSLQSMDRYQIYLWSLIIGFFFLLALGPALQLAGQVVWDKIMPYTLLITILPFLKLSGVPVRMVVMIILGVSILNAFGFRELFRSFPKNRIFTFALLGILLLQTFPRPLASTRISVPDYVEALKSLPNDGGVVDLVTGPHGTSLYYQTVHEKPTAFGYISRIPTSVYLRDLELSQVIQQKNYARLWDAYHIRYIVTHDMIDIQNIESFVKLIKVYDKDNIRIYRIECKC